METRLLFHNSALQICNEPKGPPFSLPTQRNASQHSVTASEKVQRAKWLMNILANDNSDSSVTLSRYRRTVTPSVVQNTRRLVSTPQGKFKIPPQAKFHKVALTAESIFSNRYTSKTPLRIRPDGVMYALVKEIQGCFRPKRPESIPKTAQQNKRSAAKLTPCDVLNSYVKGQSLSRNKSERGIFSFKDTGSFGMPGYKRAKSKVEQDSLYNELIRTVIQYQKGDLLNSIVVKGKETEKKPRSIGRLTVIRSKAKKSWSKRNSFQNKVQESLPKDKVEHKRKIISIPKIAPLKSGEDP